VREEEGLAARVLESLHVTLDDVRGRVARIVGRGEVIATGQIPFTPRAKKVLELSMREALSLGHNYIGTEHVLLGIVRENEGVASRILLDLGADGEKVRNAVIEMLGPHPARSPEPVRVRAPARRRQVPGRRYDALGRGLLLLGWLLFGVALGIGILIGWLIWG
jgi:ATP-dependent Clp protease ATP-binding subunit ClpC